MRLTDRGRLVVFILLEAIIFTAGMLLWGPDAFTH